MSQKICIKQVWHVTGADATVLLVWPAFGYIQYIRQSNQTYTVVATALSVTGSVSMPRFRQFLGQCADATSSPVVGLGPVHVEYPNVELCKGIYTVHR